MINGFSRHKKFFSSGLARWQDSRRRGKYLNYYIKPVQSGKNPLARNLDFYGFLGAAFLITFSAAALYTGKPVTAFFITIPLMIPEGYIAFKIRRMLDNEASAHSKLWRAGRLCQERIKKIETPEEMDRLVIEILQKMPGFSDVHRSLKEGEAKAGYFSTSVRALNQGMPVVVGTIIPGAEEKSIPAEKITVFIEEMKRLEIGRGVLVVAGSISNEGRRAARRGKKRVVLVDLYRLVDYCRLTGHEFFAAGQPNGDLGNIKRENSYKKLFRNTLGREKARGYLLSAGIMLTLYLTAVEGFLGAVYLFFGGFNMALALYCIWSDREADLLG